MANFIRKNMPNTLTCGNLFSGCVAITFALGGNPEWALTWIIIGAIFDFFDGMSARLLKVSSPIGKELDSLADDVTFGVAPSCMIFWQLGVVEYPDFLSAVKSLIPFLAFIMAAFSGLRLAKFNLDQRQTTSFIGLPVPANALFWGALIYSNPGWMNSAFSWFMILVMAFVSSWLMVSEIPMFALKFKHWGWKGNEIRYGFIILAVVLMACMGMLKAWWLIILCYFLISLYTDFRKKVSVTKEP
ncbi:CDP-diacylglycerol--serine O-phosphatidyltransferase [Prevotella cerevisiae]|uniref:CDP-diacylglycerol--serine O-phosphatidyltransferase n=1 Tax=Segatella cerevisiae TaxID=2053716 RepID=A0ABT1BV32_9BACT|nr:CDP-diacylglycerol--serine O-phosphatidyltransferase [Segatella cerevisiae]MCO6024814.1 CDP-diacylglycerol--serine O-phosphatidyltransferase [Segatella cerevisiae]